MSDLDLLAHDKIDFADLKADFPVLNETAHQKPIVYLDNAATTQKPIQVIEAVSDYYSHYNANIHRGVHTLSVKATEAYENTRQLIRNFINAPSLHEIIFTSGATESINLVAHCFERSQLKAGDEIILSRMEHHSNIVPWQLVAEQIKAQIKVIPITESGELDIQALKELISAKTKLIAIAHISNAIGTINPVEQIIQIAHQHHIPVLIDGAQAISRMPIDVKQLDCDFYAFSGHKMYGPTGTGILYAKSKWLEQMPPYQGGGDMIAEVSFEGTRYSKLPYKFEAGTPNIAGIIGLNAAINYLNAVGMENIALHEQRLLHYAHEQLAKIDGLKIIGNATNKSAVISFIMPGIHPHDIGTFLDCEGIAIRAGHHCAMPLMKHFNLTATARVSFGLYNTKEDVDQLFTAMLKLQRFFS
jgi:cysteine desulfurase / selenocysteine lyase